MRWRTHLELEKISDQFPFGALGYGVPLTSESGLALARLGSDMEVLSCFCGAHFHGCASFFLDFLGKSGKQWACSEFIRSQISEIAGMIFSNHIGECVKNIILFFRDST